MGLTVTTAQRHFIRSLRCDCCDSPTSTLFGRRRWNDLLRSSPNIPDQPGLAMSSPPDSQEDQVMLTRNKVHHLDQVITQLNEERAALLGSLNTTQPYTIILPAETLSCIFEHACPRFDFSGRHAFSPHRHCSRMPEPFPIKVNYLPQFALAAVSSHWRKAVWSNPRLWTRIDLDISARNTERKGATLRIFIENSKGLPLAITIHFCKDIDSIFSPLVHKNVDDLLIKAFPRVKELHLINPPRRWHKHTFRLTHLQDCSFDLSRFTYLNLDSQITLPSSAPTHTFSLRGEAILPDANIQLPWTALTSLNFVSVPPDISAQVLLQCPNLVYFHCRYPSKKEPLSEEVTLPHPISLQSPENFHWETYDSPWSRALIENLQAPALKEMHWGTFDDQDSNNRDIRDFFSRLPPTLTKLIIEGTTSHVEYIPESSNIKELVLNRCTTRDIRRLFQKLRINGQGGEVARPLPRLKTISLGNDIILDTDTMAPIGVFGPPYSDELVEVLEQRLDKFNRSFTFDMHTARLECTAETQTRLDKLIRRGYHINIVEQMEFNEF